MENNMIGAITTSENNFVNKSNFYQNKFTSLKSIEDCYSEKVYHVDFTQLLPVTVSIAIAYCLVILLAILGNLLVVWTVWRNSHMHTVTNYYIVNLAVSDFLVAAIVMPLKLLEYTAKCEWHVFTSDGLCSVVYYLLPTFVFASVLTLAAISLERYYAIVHPLSAMKINSKSRTRKIIAFTWVIPFVVASPFMFCRSYAFTIYSHYGTISRKICNDRFDEIDAHVYPNDPSKHGEFRKGYFIFLFCVIYVIPSVVILATCVRIAVSLLQPITVGNTMFGRKDTSRKQEENKRKVARMVVVMAITFIVFWSPQYIVSIVSQLQTTSFLRESNFLFTMLITHFFGFVNSCLNPIIYTAMSQKFRRSFKDVIRRICHCCCCCRCYCRKILPYNVHYSTPANRFTSTVRQTMIDTEGNNIALNETIGRSERFVGGRINKSSSSSGMDMDIGESKWRGEKTISKFVFTNSACSAKRSNRTPLVDTLDVDTPTIKGILKRHKSAKGKDLRSTQPFIEFSSSEKLLHL